MHCRNCGKTVGQNAKICLKCGSDPKSPGKFCHECGTQVRSNSTSCPGCGANRSGPILNLGFWSMIGGSVSLTLVSLNYLLSFIPYLQFCVCLTGPIACACAFFAVVGGFISRSKRVGEGMGLAGIIMGLGYFVLAFIHLVLYVLFLIWTWESDYWPY